MLQMKRYKKLETFVYHDIDALLKPTACETNRAKLTHRKPLIVTVPVLQNYQ